MRRRRRGGRARRAKLLMKDGWLAPAVVEARWQDAAVTNYSFQQLKKEQQQAAI